MTRQHDIAHIPIDSKERKLLCCNDTDIQYVRSEHWGPCQFGVTKKTLLDGAIFNKDSKSRGERRERERERERRRLSRGWFLVKNIPRHTIVVTPYRRRTVQYSTGRNETRVALFSFCLARRFCWRIREGGTRVFWWERTAGDDTAWRA